MKLYKMHQATKRGDSLKKYSMKFIKAILLIIIFTTNASIGQNIPEHGQEKERSGKHSQTASRGIDLRSIQKHIIKINDHLYASQFEVTNDEYSIFLNHLKQNKQTEKYQWSQIDSSQWRVNSAYNEPFVSYYHAHPAYANYPVVNVSFEGANFFCEWLTEQYNTNAKRQFKKVLFRLPTKEEWITIAKCGNPSATYPWEGIELKTKKGLYRCNFIRAVDDTMGVAGNNNDHADITAPSKSYWPNQCGIYNLSGNVAEMIADKGKTMGGSWLDEAEAMKIESPGKFATYNTPMPTIGFRYVMEIIEM
jgi:formylglycine-generating enzyme required for sulfatase activity